MSFQDYEVNDLQRDLETPQSLHRAPSPGPPPTYDSVVVPSYPHEHKEEDAAGLVEQWKGATDSKKTQTDDAEDDDGLPSYETAMEMERHSKDPRTNSGRVLQHI